jgi:NAD(P)-dependent dehydrogenase (short-subunit alcohol dehydrogenase family)
MTPSADRNLTAEMRDILKVNYLVPRFGQSEDVANLVAFLSSDEASFINGQVICVDGGFLAHTPVYAQFISST